MALAKQFYSSFKSYNGWDYYLEIWVEGYSGSASEISIGAGGPVITYGTDEQDRFSPILSSKLELPFMVTNTTQDAFIKNIRENFNEQDVYIHLYRASSSDYSSVAPLWSGFVLMDLSSSPDLYYPYPVTLTAVDGLSLLKEIDFAKSGTAGSYTDADMYSSNGRFTFWLKEILLKSGASTTTQGSTQDYKFTTAINWFNSVMPTITQSTDPFYQTKCNTKMFFSKDSDENFTVVNCYDVLKNLLKHWGARIIYWKHIFYIVQIQEYVTAESGTYANPDNIDTRTYTKTGAFDSSSDNLGDSYWTRYNLLIDDVTGGIQKLAGSQFNYLPQLKRTQAKFIDYGNKNYFGGLPYDLTTGQTDVIYQDTISDVSVDGSMILIIPLDVTMNVAYSGTLAMSLTFRMYITDGATTYYLRYDPSNTPKYYWENATTANLNNKKTVWRSNLDNIVGTQTKVGFHEQIEFKDVSGSALTLTGDWDIYTDIDNWGANSGSFKFIYAVNGLFNLQVLYAPSASTIYWTNTLNPNYQTPLNPSVIGQTNQPTAYNPNYSLNPTTSNSIVSYTSQLNINPFEGKLLIVNASASGALYGSFVSVSPNPTTKDSEIVDFGDLIWGDTLLASSEGSLKVWNGSSFVKSNVIGTWGLGSTSGSNSFTEMLLSEYLYGQTKVIESPSMRLVIGETNKNQNDGSGSRPNYINPIGRLKGYSATGTTPYYIFKSGSFHLLKDEVDYQGYQIIRDTQSITKTDDIIIGPDILQDKTNKIGQKTPQTNTLVNKLTQNSYITTVSAIKSAFGNDVAVNGIFATDTGWTKGTGWSISSNKAIFSPTGSTSDIKQDTLTNALTYKIIVTLTLSAGGLSVKAGSSGNSTVLSASGTYEVFSTCAGSTDVIFEASAAFEGYIEKVVVQQQVPVTSISINAIGTAVFKTNDVLNIADIDGDEVNEFTVSADQGASDTSISVTSKLITEDILEGSIILVNQNDLAAQYQNKTKGTVGGFDITATSIDSGSVAISSYIDDDSFGTASATSLATSESIKAYVDTQVGSADTLQEVTDNGNTTTNSIMIGSSSSPSEKLEVSGNVLVGGGTLSRWLRFKRTDGFQLGFGEILSNGELKIGGTNVGVISFYRSAGEVMRINGANVLIGTTTDNSSKVNIATSGSGSVAIRFNSDVTNDLSINNYSNYSTIRDHALSNNRAIFHDTGEINLPYSLGVGLSGLTKPSEKLHVVGDILATGDSHADAFKPAVSGNPIKFKNFDSSTEFARITDGGNVLIGGTVLTNAQGWGKNLQIINSGSNGASLSVKDSNNEYNLATYGGNFLISDGIDERLIISGIAANAGQLQLPSYGSGSFTGTETYFLAVTSGGDVVEADSSALPGGPYLPLTGGTLTGGLTGTTATFSGQVSAGTHFKLQSGGKLYSNASNVTLQSASGSYLGFNISTSEKMRLNDTGLGIGTSSPSEKLHILGSNATAQIEGNSGLATMRLISGSYTTGYDMLLDTGGTAYLFNRNNGNLSFGTNNSEKMRLTSGGNLLIGTTSDDGSSKLQVAGDVKFYGDTSGRDMLWDSSLNSLLISSEARLRLGGNNDFWIYHDGTDSQIINRGSGDLIISGHVANGDIRLINQAGGGASNYIVLDSSEEKSIFYQNTRHNDNVEATFGNSDDFKIYHYNSEQWLDNSTGDWNFRQIGVGNMIFQNLSDNKDIIFQSDNGSGGITTYLELDGSQTTVNFYKTVLIGTTTDDGSSKLQVAGNIKVGDGNSFLAGTSNDIEIVHVNDQSFMINNTGDLIFEQRTDDRDIYFKCDDGSGGTETYFFLDGSIGLTTFPDNKKLAFGTGNDLQIKHTGSHSFITQAGTGNLYISNTRDGKDIILQSDNGTGGTADYITLDGSQTTINLQKTVLIGTTTNTGAYKIDVAGKQRVQDTLELDDVLMLNAISTPSDPAAGKSVIYMDSSDGGIKCKINVGGTVVTRTIASFE